MLQNAAFKSLTVTAEITTTTTTKIATAEEHMTDYQYDNDCH